MKEKLPLLDELFPPMTGQVNSAQRPSARDGADRSSLSFFSYGAKVKLIDKIKLAFNPNRLNRRVEPRTLSPVELHRLYAGTLVPQHRYLSAALTEAMNSPEIGPHPSKWLAGVSGIDLSKLTDAWLNTNRNSEYEQLYCIGLEPDTGQLTGMVTVKRGSGYSGGPRTAGSREYVAFWVDWGSGFRYEGTASVVVHDFGWLPSAGLEYKVSLPVDFLSFAQQDCEGRKTVKVRAVLSWNTPPSTKDPNAPVVWGNIVECRIVIPSRKQTQIPRLAAVRTEEIEQTGIEGEIVDAAIKALKGTAFGSNAGLTVAPDSAPANSGVTDRSFTVKARDVQDYGKSFSLHVWNRRDLHHGATSSLDHSLNGFFARNKN
ncbi:MAG: hypothetical protein ABR905_05950 [Terracidiphilus sp.]|jgi:hypothetical protein